MRGSRSAACAYAYATSPADGCGNGTASRPRDAVACSPISNEGTCYKPGEYCRDDDHGVSGVAGDGQAIICEYNDGWRWEPA